MKHKSTVSVHAGRQQNIKGVVNPVEPSSAFQYIDSGDQFYPRYFNTPNQQYIIDKLVSLEQAQDGVIFSSGMAAMGTTLLGLLNSGDHVLMLENLYGGTLAFAADELPKAGIQFDTVRMTVDGIMSSVKENTRVIFLETPANPLMQLVDLAELADQARQRGILTIVDNTFASPINQNPIEFGIDIVIHSGTKYLGGHSDLSFGATLGPGDLIEKVRHKAINLGGNLNSWTCYLIERSVKTLDIRVQRQNENAMAIATFMEQHPGIDKVYYPGLASHPDHQLATRQMKGFGGMIAFDLSGDECPKTFLNQLQIITPAMSLGGIESTVTMPIHTSHKPTPVEERKRLGIGDRLVRLSVGIEGAADLISDLDQALDSLNRSNSATTLVGS